MKPVDMARLKIGQFSPDALERAALAYRFEQSLNSNQAAGNNSSGQGSSDDQGGDPSHSEHNSRSETTEEPIAPDVMRMFYQALQYGVDADAGGKSTLLTSLLHDIADAAKAGKRIRGDRWRLNLRLRQDLLNLTELEVAYSGGELCVVLRTACPNAYRAIVEALPALQDTLTRNKVSHRPAVVFWIAAEELQ